MSRSTVINVAEMENGVVEYPSDSNRTKYGKWYGDDGKKWCGMFVSWVFYKAGYPLPSINSDKGYSSCSDAYYFWKRHNRFVKKPRAGDIVLFDLNKNSGRISDHTGIFVRWVIENQTFESWEGNTSSKSSYDNDGGKVMLKTRNYEDVREFVDPGVFDS